MPNVLYLSYDGMTDPLGRSQVLPYLTGLAKLGITFHLISFEKRENFEAGRKTVERIVRESGMVWHPLTYNSKPPVISTMYDLHRMYRLSKRLISKHQITAVHCRSYISGLAGLWLRRKLNTKFIFDIRGFWADERVDGGLWNLKNPVYNSVYRFFKSKEKDMFKEANAVVSLTEKAAEYIRQYMDPVRVEPFVIPCCADLDHFNKKNISTELRQHIKIQCGLDNQGPVISYLGALGTWYLLDEMLQFFSKFLSNYPDAAFLFITKEPAEPIYRQASQFGIPHSKIKVFAATREQVPAALSLSDVSVFFIKPSFSKMASSPTKQGEIMGMGIPLICNTGVGDTDEIVKKYTCGDLIDLQDPQSMDKAIARFEKTKAISSDLIVKGAEASFSLHSGIEKYRNIYQTLGILS